eukprot:4249887-Pyramimonas_sp.AAC.1
MLGLLRALPDDEDCHATILALEQRCKTIKQDTMSAASPSAQLFPPILSSTPIAIDIAAAAARHAPMLGEP